MIHEDEVRLNAPATAHRARRRILLAWEMGEGLGHAARLLQIATRLRADGWSPVVAARHPDALAGRYAQAGIPVVAAPEHRSCFVGPGRFRAASYADIMGVCGYADAGRLARLIAAWDRLLEQHAPAAVIADYAPLLSLAAFGRVPVICIGDGFVTPHGLDDGSFPRLDPDADPVWDPATLLDAARRVQAQRGLPAPASLPQIIEGAGQVVCVPPELDIHAATRSTPAAGAWDEPLPVLAPPERPAVFAYLRMNHPLARLVMQALADERVPGECYLHAATGAIVAAAERGGLRVHATPPLLRDALVRASLLIHHGGIGSMQDAISAGRPQLLLPRHLEQVLNARQALANVPGAFGLRAGATPSELRQRLPRLVRDPRPLRAAQAAATRLAGRDSSAWSSLQRLLAQVA